MELVRIEMFILNAPELPPIYHRQSISVCVLFVCCPTAISTHTSTHTLTPTYSNLIKIAYLVKKREDGRETKLAFDIKYFCNFFLICMKKKMMEQSDRIGGSKNGRMEKLKFENQNKSKFTVNNNINYLNHTIKKITPRSQKIEIEEKT